MPYRQFRKFIGLDYRIGRTLDAPTHAQGPQKVTHQRGLAGTQVTLKFDVGVSNRRAVSKSLGRTLGSLLIRPVQGFYNRGVTHALTQIDNASLVSRIQAWGGELGFSQIGVTGVDLSSAEPGLSAWLAHGFHGSMGYMAAHGLRRARPGELVPGTVSIITARMDYLNPAAPEGWQAIEFERIQRHAEGTVSLYARGRDYHKVLRRRLQTLCDRMAEHLGPLGYRVFTDSAPVLEVELAARSGLGWRGKHTLLLNRDAGSLFFLGEIFVDLALPPTAPVGGHCGSCSACIDVCPTQAIVAPYQLDARRCISYLTIEHSGPIPLELRRLMGNRIYGCDDCQLVCPWNKYAKRSQLPDFEARPGLTGARLAALLDWSETEFLQYCEGSPIRRIGHERWLRNVAVALGNALRAGASGAGATAEELAAMRVALQRRLEHPSALVREHVVWAMQPDGCAETEVNDDTL